MGRAEKTEDGKHALSTSSILIFSGFLIGLAVSQPMGSELSFCVMMCGVAGLLAFYVLDHANERRGRQRIQRVRHHMEQRLRKHISTGPAHDIEDLTACLNDIEAELMKI
jgi:hypothetical protein